RGRRELPASAGTTGRGGNDRRARRQGGASGRPKDTMPPRGWQRRVERLALDLRPRFVADVMLGRLARWLRALGYDTAYVRDASDRQLLGLALREDRRLLTRDVALARLARVRGMLVGAGGPDARRADVVAGCGYGV